MNETRTINLNGLVYHIDYDAYQQLRDYLHDIELRLPQDDRQEVMLDIEARIAELLQKSLFAKNIQVVNLEIVTAVKKQIGEPSEFGPNRRPKVKTDKSQNSGCGRVFSIVLNVLLAILAFPVIMLGLIVLFAIVVSLFAFVVAGSTTVGAVFPLAATFIDLMFEGGVYLVPLLLVALIAIVILPIVMVVHTIIKYMRTRRGPKARFWWLTILFWLAAVIFWGASLVHVYHSVDNAPDILKAMTFEGMDVDDENGLVSSTLQLDPYHSICINGAAELHLSIAEQQSTTLTTNLMPLMSETENLKAEVRDSVLYIDVINTLPIDELMVDFAIASPVIRKITVYGASKIETSDGQVFSQPDLIMDLNGAAEADMHLQVGALIVDAKGASSLELEGTADKADITLAGAGKLDAEDFVVQTMHINCAGAGEAEIYVVRELWAQAAGASKITYKGNPRMKHQLAVGGSVIKRDK